MNSFNGFLNTLLVETLTEGSWIKQERKDATTYAKVISKQSNGAYKVVSCDDDRMVATTTSTKGWYPNPVSISEDDVPSKIKAKIEKKISRMNESLDEYLSDVRKAVRLAIDKNSDEPNFSGCVNKFGREDVLTILTQEYGSKKTAERMLGESLKEGASWHQKQRPVKLYDTELWTVVSGKDGIGVMRFKTKEEAEKNLEGLKKHGNGQGAYILPPHKNESLTEGKITIKKYDGEYRVPSPNGALNETTFTLSRDERKKAKSRLQNNGWVNKDTNDFNKLLKPFTKQLFKLFGANITVDNIKKYSKKIDTNNINLNNVDFEEIASDFGNEFYFEKDRYKSLTEGKITIKKYDGEYRVPSPNGTEGGAYYTNDKEDAVGSAIDMYKRAGFTITSSDISFRTVSDFDKYTEAGSKDVVDKVFKEDIDMQLQEESKDQEKWSEAMDKAEEKLGYRPKASDKKDDKFYATATTIYKKLTSKSNVEKCADKLKESESDDWKHHNDGWDAHENDKPKSACPHKKGTKEYNDWKHGWETRNERYGHVDKEGKAKTDVYYSVNYQDKDFPAIQHKGTTDMVDSRTGKKVNRAYSWKRITKQAWEKMLDKIDK